MIEVVLPIPPVPKQSGQTFVGPGGKAMFRADPKVKKFATQAHAWLQPMIRELGADADGAFFVEIIFYLHRPKSPKYREFPCGRPDLDNLTKMVLDTIDPPRAERRKGRRGLIADDARVVSSIQHKRWVINENESPEIVVRLWNLQTEPHPMVTIPPAWRAPATKKAPARSRG